MDDIHYCISIPSKDDEAVEVMNCCLKLVMGWKRANKLKLNLDKIEMLLVKTPTIQVIYCQSAQDGP